MNLARLNDIGTGVCYCHKTPISMTGRVITVASTVECNGLGVTQLFSIVLGGCGHAGRMIVSSSTVEAEGLGVCRLFDSFQGCFNGNLVSASSNTEAGD